MELVLGASGLALVAWLLLLYFGHRHSRPPGTPRAGPLNAAMLALGLVLSIGVGASPVVRLALAFLEVASLPPERKATGLADRIEQAMQLMPVAALALPVAAVSVAVFLKRRRRQAEAGTPGTTAR